MAENPILDIPFDEANGSTVAHDFGPGAHHASIEAGEFIPGRFGNCVHFPGVGKAEIIEPVINFAQDFTFTCWVKADARPQGPTRSYAIFNFPGYENFVNLELFADFLHWQNVAIVQEGLVVTAYVDGKRRGSFTRQAVMTGCAVVNNAQHNTGGFCSLDGARAYDRALSHNELEVEIDKTVYPVSVYLGGSKVDDIGFRVKKMNGLLRLPQAKDNLQTNWPDMHGIVADTSRRYRQVRELKFDCWYKALTKDELVSKGNAIMNIFEQPGTVRLMVDAGTKPLVYEVVHPNEITFDSKWTDQGVYFARFELNMIEQLPVKRVLFVNGSSCSITLSTKTPVKISWGDGSHTYNVVGESVTAVKNYSSAGGYYVVIAGNIEEITSFSSTAATVWGRI